MSVRRSCQPPLHARVPLGLPFRRKKPASSNNIFGSMNPGPGAKNYDAARLVPMTGHDGVDLRRPPRWPTTAGLAYMKRHMKCVAIETRNRIDQASFRFRSAMGMHRSAWLIRPCACGPLDAIDALGRDALPVCAGWRKPASIRPSGEIPLGHHRRRVPRRVSGIAPNLSSLRGRYDECRAENLPLQSSARGPRREATVSSHRPRDIPSAEQVDKCQREAHRADIAVVHEVSIVLAPRSTNRDFCLGLRVR